MLQKYFSTRFPRPIRLQQSPGRRLSAPLVHSLFAHTFFEYDLKEAAATRAAAHSCINHVIYRPKDLVGAEAFARFADGNGGYEDTTAMIELAKQNGSIIKLSDLVISRVCEFIKTGILDEKDLSYIQVNLSVNDWNDPELFNRVMSTVKKYETGTSQIMLELTEDCMSEHMETVVKNVEEFNRVGIKLAMDNFGAANTNVTQMLHMPLNMIKIDKDLIAKAHLSSHSMEILSEEVKLFEKFGLEMVAEGVENVNQIDMVKEMGCTFGQGNCYGMPVSQADFGK